MEKPLIHTANEFAVVVHPFGLLGANVKQLKIVLHKVQILEGGVFAVVLVH